MTTRDDGSVIEPEYEALLVRERELLGRSDLTEQEKSELLDVQTRMWDGPVYIEVRRKLGLPPRHPDPSKRPRDGERDVK